MIRRLIAWLRSLVGAPLRPGTRVTVGDATGTIIEVNPQWSRQYRVHFRAEGVNWSEWIDEDEIEVAS